MEDDVSEKDDTEDLDAALAELSAHRLNEQAEPDPETKALLGRSDVRDAIVERREIAERPNGPAPEAIEVPGEGALLVQAEAAATYVAPVEVTLPAAPRMPSGPVRIKTGVDPRRAKTARVVQVSAGAKATVEETPEVRAPKRSAPVPAVSARRAGSRADASRRSFGVMIGAAILFVAGAVTVLAGVRGPGRESGDATSNEGAGRPAQVTARGTDAPSADATSPSVPSGGSVAAMGTSVVMSGAQPSATTAKSGTARSVTTATEDPYADASALPASASSGPTTSAAPQIPSTGAAPSAATTTAASTQAGTKPSSDRWFQKEQ